MEISSSIYLVSTNFTMLAWTDGLELVENAHIVDNISHHQPIFSNTLRNFGFHVCVENLETLLFEVVVLIFYTSVVDDVHTCILLRSCIDSKLCGNFNSQRGLTASTTLSSFSWFHVILYLIEVFRQR